MIEDQQDQILVRDHMISQYDIMTKAQADEIATANAKLNSVWRSPLLYLGIGLAAGLYLKH